MISVIINDSITKLLPTSWDELAEHEYIELIKIILNQPKDLIIPLFINYCLFDKKCQTADFIYSSYIYELEPLFAWILDKNARINRVPIKDLNINSEIFVAPAARLINITGNEIVMLEYFRTAYEISQKIEYLHKLVAVLYRPMELNEQKRAEMGDDRIPFNDNLIDFFAKNISVLEIHYIYAVYYWYSNVMYSRYKEYADVFNQKNTDATRAKDPEEWRHILRMLRNNKMGSQKEVGSAFIGDILYEMRMLEKERQELVKIYKQ